MASDPGPGIGCVRVGQTRPVRGLVRMRQDRRPVIVEARSVPVI
jgi:hypothetical protein